LGSFQLELREQKWLPGYPVSVTFTKSAASVLRVEDWSSNGLGHGYVFYVFDRAWLHGKKVAIRWMSEMSGPGGSLHYVRVYDGEYDRENDADWPDPGAAPTLKGNGLLQTVFSHASPFAWTEEEAVIDTSGGSEDKVTLMVVMADGHASTKYRIDVDWLKILEDSTELCVEDFDGAVTMERTGTDKDYGYIGSGECTGIFAPTVTTQAATGICEGVGTLHGTITDTGGENCDERGFEWGLVSGGPYPNSWTEAGSFGAGAFSHAFTDFPTGTKIYYRAKAHNSGGWSYGSEKSFTTCGEPPPAPPYVEPKIELRLSDTPPSEPDPPRTIYRDLFQLPNPVLLGITIKFYNFDDVDLYFTITGQGTGYTFGSEDLGLLASGSNRYENLDEIASRAKPGSPTTESITLTLRAYTDAGHTDLKWTYQRTVTIVFIDSNDGSWTIDEYDNFDDGTVMGWAGVSAAVAAASDYALSAPYSLKATNTKSNIGLSTGGIQKAIVTPNKNTIYGIFNIRLDCYAHRMKCLYLYEDSVILIFLGETPVSDATITLVPEKWLRIVVPLPKDSSITVKAMFTWWNSSTGVTTGWLWLDDFKVVSK
jgi:hypothetical protein